MASRAMIKSVNWSKIMERVAPEAKAKMNSFKTKSDSILAEYMRAKEFKLSIDWAHYQKAVANTALVADFQKKYEALEIPKPKDTKSSIIAQKMVEDKENVVKFLKESDDAIASVMKDLDRLNKLPPFEQMTEDDARENFPQLRRDFKKNPVYPHVASNNDFRMTPK